MSIKVDIDPDAGFCPGVVAAIERAESILEKEGRLLCLGELVHNEEETERLRRKGLLIIDHEELPDAEEEKVLIRAHGEPPETYRNAGKHGVIIEDATCPVVIRLQEKVGKAYREMEKRNGQVVIFGKAAHPEVIGLQGHAEGRAVVVSKIEDLVKIDMNKPVRLFSQTTMDKEAYGTIAGIIRDKTARCNNEDVVIFRSICGKVANRVEGLRKFAKAHDMVVFVSGKNSSNGAYLFTVCREANPASIRISSESELDPAALSGKNNIGVSGATSTPSWLMKKIADKIRTFS
ncbi:MAG: 4-hydroxy-3-methylbut-2-enyl diphosphate reductase [Bacteroidetes bacterium]|nr:4-hydroxy-3-methylbut-2-enyl diphosphate reductase [Bacteroidota bacterium]